jgi:type IV pilus assembly protein PilQ
MWLALASLALAGQHVNLDVQDADVRHVIRLIADVGGVNYVLDDGVQGTITVHLVDVTWEDALSAVLQARGLAATPVGTTFVIAPIVK